MDSTYKNFLMKEMENIPEEMLPDVYQILQILKKQHIKKGKKKAVRNSLKGIWKGSNIKEQLFSEAKKSIFPYETA